MSARRVLRRRPPAAILAVVALIGLAGCSATIRHQVDPIHITLDVNLKVDRELDDFFAFEKEIKDEVLEGTPDAFDGTDTEKGGSR